MPGSRRSSPRWRCDRDLHARAVSVRVPAPRAPLRDQAPGLYHTARLLGASPTEAGARPVVLPLLRPAIAAGVAIVMMETLTDYATVQYFRVDTVMVGVFRIWQSGTYTATPRVRSAAPCVLGVALLIIAVERIGRRKARLRRCRGRGQRPDAPPAAGSQGVRRGRGVRGAGCLSRRPAGRAPRDVGGRRADQRPRRHADARRVPGVSLAQSANLSE